MPLHTKTIRSMLLLFRGPSKKIQIICREIKFAILFGFIKLPGNDGPPDSCVAPCTNDFIAGEEDIIFLDDLPLPLARL